MLCFEKSIEELGTDANRGDSLSFMLRCYLSIVTNGSLDVGFFFFWVFLGGYVCS